MPSPSLESSLVRILLDDQESRRPEGAGFLVTPKHILTCAHVVNAVLHRNKHAADQPDAEVFVDFPLLNNRPLLRAKILHWFPVQEDAAVGDLEDIAVLELLPDGPLPAEAQPAPVVVLNNSSSFFAHRVRMCGFPVSVDHGTYANGILQGLNSKGWVEIHHQDNNLVEQGFSGTAAWAETENAVYGMTVSRLSRRNAAVVAYMIPAATLIRAFPAMEKLSRPANPYQGLQAFGEKDSRFYFGRNRSIAELEQRVADQPFTAVIGASGSGKSSLVFAGLIPPLRRTGNWLIAHCRPKKQPFHELAACLLPFLYDDPIFRLEKIKELKEKLAAGSVALTDIINDISGRNNACRFLLLVDQFEELYTLNADKEARCFIDRLLEAGQAEVLSVVITMRADFLETALGYGLFAEALNKALLVVPPINEAGLLEAVQMPASLQEVSFEPGLIDLIIRDVGEEPGSLPLLEFCLTQLWERQTYRRITHDAYTAIGGVQQALANHADAVYAEFTEPEREQLRHIFLKLVRPGQGTEDTRQVATVGQIQVEYRGLITRLADKRLIVTGRDEERGEETVEVVHEALIRRWQTLRQWVDEEREFLVWQEKLRVLLGQWEESGKDDGALLRGLPLNEALRWRETHVIHLTGEKQKFIAASETLREQTRKAKDRQRRRNITSLALGLVIAVLLSLFSGVQWRNAEQKTIEAEKEKDKAEHQTLAASYNLAKAFEEKALTALKAAEWQGDVEYKKAILFTSAALVLEVSTNESALKTSSIGVLFAPEAFNAIGKELAMLKGHKKTVTSAAFSPDGKTVVSASFDDTVRIWDAASGKELVMLKGHEDSVNSAAFSPDGKKIVSASDDDTVRIWDAASGKELAVLEEHGWDSSIYRYIYIHSATFSPDGKRVASASYNDTVRLWDAASGKELAVLNGHEYQVTCASFSPDGKTIASASWDKTVRLWDVETGKELNVFRGHQDGVASATFSPDGKTIVSASHDDTVRIWDAASGKELNVLRGHQDDVASAAFSPDGKTIVSASRDDTVRIWDAASGKELIMLKGHEDPVTSAAFSPDGKKIVSASFDDTVRIWDAASDKELVVLKSHEKSVNSGVFSPDGKTIASASWDKTVRLWDAETGKELNVFRGHQDGVASAAFSPDGKKIVSASDDDTVRIWDAASGKELNVLRGHQDDVASAAFSPDGKKIVSASDDDTVRIWDTASGNELIMLKGHENRVTSAAFSPDGKKIVSASFDDTVRIWDAVSGKELAVLKGHENRVNSAAFSPDGKTVVSASDDDTVRIWDTASGNELIMLKGHENWVNSAAFSPDGKTIVSASRDDTVRIWDAASGKELVVLKHESFVNSAAFSPNGKTVVSASLDKTLRIWDLKRYDQFLQNYNKPTPLYHTFIEAVKFLWQLDVQGLEIVETERRTPADIEKYGTLLAPPPPGQSKFDQVLEWAEKQQGI